MTRAGGAHLPKGPKKKGWRKRKKEIAEGREAGVDAGFGEEYTTTTRVSSSKYWQPNVNEIDDFGPVKVYDSAGKVVRVIERKELMRPWQMREGVRWNTGL